MQFFGTNMTICDSTNPKVVNSLFEIIIKTILS